MNQKTASLENSLKKKIRTGSSLYYDGCGIFQKLP